MYSCSTLVDKWYTYQWIFNSKLININFKLSYSKFEEAEYVLSISPRLAQKKDYWQLNAGNPGTIRPQKSGHVEIKGFFNMKMTGLLRQCCQGPSKGTSPVSFLGIGLLLHTLYILVNCSSHVFALSFWPVWCVAWI